jgi:2-succinyl-6-hydroxy-2,4-cyclohexadiene-1-carboxylate synthase
MADVRRGLVDRWRTISLDLPGHGRSSAITDPADCGLTPTCDAIARSLDENDLPSAAFLGYSMGGRIALGFALQHPERVQRLVLVGASAGIADPTERAARLASDAALATQIENDGVAAFVEHWMALPLFASQSRLGSEVLAAARAQRLACDAHGLAASLRGIGTGAQPPLHEALARVRAPVLLVVGEEDPKFRGIADDLAKRLPNARVAVVAGAGHAVHLEACAAFLDRVRAFLDEERGSKS